LNPINKKKKFLTFDNFSIIPLIEGIDLFLNLSIVTFLSIFFFENFDTRTSILVTLFVVLLSFFSRFFSFEVLKVFSSLFKKNSFNLLFLLTLSFLFPIFLTNKFPLISLIIFCFSRVATGIILSLLNYCNFNSNKFKNENNFFLKYSLLMIFGLIIGSFFFLIIDDILSIQQMNSWGWKTIYVFLSLVTLMLMSVLYKFNSLITLDFQEIKNASNNEIKLKTYFFKNIFIIIPFTVFVIYSSSHWLPKFSNPENMQFLEFNLILIILVSLVTFFIFPIIDLVGRNRSKKFFSMTIVVISLVSFFFEYTSSYSIELLKFFIVLVSSFTLSIYLLNNKKIGNYDIKELIYLQNLYLLILSIFIPILFYYFINFSIRYNEVYLIIGVIFLISIFSDKYVKDR
jgi:hypothetical protein